MSGAVKISTSPDRSRGAGGFGIIEISGIERQQGWKAPGFSVVRSDTRFLGQDGWQVAAKRLLPDRFEAGEHGLRLFVGPQVVDQMEPASYRLTLFDGEENVLTWAMTWRNVPKSPGGGSSRQGRVGGVPPTEPTAKVDLQKPEPPPEEAPPEKTLAEEPEPPPEVDKDPLSPEPSEETPPPSPPPPERKSSVLTVIFALVIVMSLVAGGAVWWWNTPFQLPPVPSPGGDPSEAGSPPLPPPLPPEPPFTVDHARELMRGEGSAESAFELARRLTAQGGPSADAAFPLFEYAAERGHVESQLETGRYLDPSLSDEERRGYPADAALALGWYEKAVRNGVAGAQENLRRLQQWMRNNPN